MRSGFDTHDQHPQHLSQYSLCNFLAGQFQVDRSAIRPPLLRVCASPRSDACSPRAIDLLQQGPTVQTFRLCPFRVTKSFPLHQIIGFKFFQNGCSCRIAHPLSSRLQIRLHLVCAPSCLPAAWLRQNLGGPPPQHSAGFSADPGRSLLA